MNCSRSIPLLSEPIRLNYEKSFGDHNLTAFAGYEQSQGYDELLRGRRRNVISKLKLDLNLSDNEQERSNGKSNEYGRVNYFGTDGGSRYDAFEQSNVPNPNITWEEAKNFNAGFDANMLDGKFSMSFDYFYEKRREILITRNALVPNYTGLQLPQENLGKVDNEGIEVLANYQNTIGDLTYNIGGNFQFSDNRIVYIDEPNDVPDFRQAEGNPIDSRITYKTNGIFRDEADLANPPKGIVVIPGQAPGDIRYVDVNGDGKIDGEDQYRRNISATPKI